MDQQIQNDLKIKLQEKFGFNIANFEEINKGHSNKLYRLTSTAGENLFVKIYFSKERRNLEKEFQFVSYLQEKNNKNTPKAFFKNEDLNYAVYSYEEGTQKTANELSDEDLQTMASFLAFVHNLEGPDIYQKFLPSNMPAFSLSEYIEKTQKRVEKFVEYTNSKDLHPSVKKFLSSVDIVKVISDQITEAIKGITPDELHTPLEQSLRRISPVDFGPHNIIFKPNGDKIFVDFEYSGIDDPMRVVAEMINHDQTYDMSQSKKQLFLDEYKARVNLPETMFQRLDLLIKLNFIDWIAIYLVSLTPEKIVQRQFANKDFNLDRYIANQIEKITARLK